MARQKGFTLIELMVGLGVLSVLILLATVLSTWATYRYFSVRDRLLTETIAYQAENIFRGVFGQAVDVAFTGSFSADGLPEALAGRTGQIYDDGVALTGQPERRRFDFDRISASKPWMRVATFYRENSTGITTGLGVKGAGATAKGGSLPTMVFYRSPTVDKSGVIFFDLSSLNNNNALKTPDYGDVFIDRISSFEIVKTRHVNPSFNKTTSIEVNLKFRYHLFAGGKASWCPMEDISSGASGCSNGSVSRDIERHFVVTLGNNLLKAAGSGYFGSVSKEEERVMGDLYFFRMSAPARW